MPAIVDLRGTADHGGRLLDATIVALADQVAAAAGAVMGKAERRSRGGGPRSRLGRRRGRCARPRAGARARPVPGVPHAGAARPAHDPVVRSGRRAARRGRRRDRGRLHRARAPPHPPVAVRGARRGAGEAGAAGRDRRRVAHRSAGRRHARGDDRTAGREERRGARAGADADRAVRALRGRAPLPGRRACGRGAGDVPAVGRRRDPEPVARVARAVGGVVLDLLDVVLSGGDARGPRCRRGVARARHGGLRPDARGRGLAAPPSGGCSTRSCAGPRRAARARSSR